MIKNHYLSMAAVLLGLTSGSLVKARAEVTFSMAIVADNDYAVFAGTANGITHLLYQNDYSWPEQIPNLSTLNFTLPAGATTFYVLAMGGGGVEENIQGLVNGVDMVSIEGVKMSSNLNGWLTGWTDNPVSSPGSVAEGDYDVILSDVQNAFDDLIWSDPVIGGGTVTWSSGFSSGYVFQSNTAHLFSFAASDVGVESIPEPSTLGLAALGGASLWMLRRRKSK